MTSEEYEICNIRVIHILRLSAATTKTHPFCPINFPIHNIKQAALFICKNSVHSEQRMLEEKIEMRTLQ